MTDIRDALAEQIVVGCCVDNARGSELAHQRLTVDDFYDPVLADLFAYAPHLPATRDQLEPNEADMLHDVRARIAAERCHIRLEDVQEVVALRPVMSDESGSYARRVLDAARRHRAALAIEQARVDIDGGIDLDDVLPGLLAALTTA